MIKIIIADDHRIFAEGLKSILKAFNKYEVIDVANNGQELLEILTSKLPDIILLDLNMPIMRGEEAALTIVKKYPSVKILVLSMEGDETSLNMMIRIGIRGFVLKQSSSNELEIALDEVYHNGSYFSQELLKSIVFKKTETVEKKRKSSSELSNREVEIIKLLCLGWSNIEIGKQLFISPRTVEIHKGNIFAKTKSKNTINMMLYAIKHKIVEIDLN